MAESTLVQLRVPGDLLAAIDQARGEQTRTSWLLLLASRALDDEPADAAVPVMAGSARILPAGEPAPGVLCMHPACWQRDCRRFGRVDDHGGLPLCRAHEAALVGQAPTRPHSPLPAARSVTANA